MKRKPGSLNFSGRLGGIISIYTDKNGIEIQRAKGGPTKKQIEKLPQFEAQRKNMTDFAQASTYAKKFRKIFANLLGQVPETTFGARMVAHILALIKQDERNEKGFRVLLSKHIRDFKKIFLDKHNTSGLVTVKTNRNEKDNFILTIKAVPELLKKQAGTHYQVTSYLYEYFPGYRMREVLETNLLSTDGSHSNELLQHHIPADATAVFLHGVSIVFFQETDGEYRKLTGNGLNGGWISGV